MFDKKAYDREYSRRYRQDHKAERIEYQKQYRQQLKQEVLTHYSALGYLSCGCCGEVDLNGLSIDHIQGGGRAHRKALNKGSSAFYFWLKRNGYPEGYQTLCLSCNNKKKKWEDETGNRGNN